jgi:ABC-2 type transport system ATP-binding protein
LICTHILPDVQSISDAVVILARGRVQIAERLHLLTRPAKPSLEVRLHGSSHDFLERIRGRGVAATTRANGTLVLEGSPGELADLAWQLARECGIGLRSMTPSRNSLEEIFLSAVREEPRVD